MSRPAAALLQELSALKQRTVELERELGLAPAPNTPAPPVLPGGASDSSQAQLREALKRALSEWGRTFDAVELPMAVLDGHGVLLRLNRAALELAGRPLEELELRRLGEVALPAPWPQAAHFLATVLRDPTASATWLQDEASGRTWELSIRPDDAEPAERARVVLVLRDVTRLLASRE